MNYLKDEDTKELNGYLQETKKSILTIIIYTMLFIFLLIMVTRGQENYALKYTKAFKLDWTFMSNLAKAESNNDTNKISKKNAYGRYQITKIWLKDYCKYNNFDPENIKDVKNFLLNDKNNCYIAAWTIRFWLNRGFVYREIIQIWLWGLKNVYVYNRWSNSFEKKVFGNLQKRRLNYKIASKILGLKHNIKEK